MADDIILSAGTADGATIATEDTGGAEYQKFKLVDGTAASTTMIAGGGGVEAGALRVTVASDSTGVLSVDDNGGALTVDNGGTFATQATLQANSGVDIGDVDVTSVIPGTGATNAGKAIGTAAGATDTGTAALVIRDDTLSALSDAEGDYVPLRVGSTGALHVTGGGGGTEYTDDTSTHSSGSTVGGVIMAVAVPTDTAIDANDMGVPAMSLDRRLHTDADLHVAGTAASVNSGSMDAGTLRVAIADDNDTINVNVTTSAEHDTENAAAGAIVSLSGGRFDSSPRTLGDGDAGAIALDADGAVQVSDGGNALTVDGTVTAAPSVTGGGTEAAAQRVTIANDSTGLVSVDDGGGALTVDWAGTAPPIGAGVEATALRVTVATDSTGVLSVDDGGSALTVDNGGTFVVQEDGAALTALQLIDNPVVAHDAAASGSTGVSMAGGLATNSIEGLTQVAANDASRITTDLNGCVVTRNATTLEELIDERVSNTNGTSTDFTNFAAGGATIHNYITSVTIANVHASTNGHVDLRDGAAGSVKWTFPAPAGGGATHNFNPPLKFAANTAVAYDVSAAITTVYISVNGFQAQG